MNLADIVIWRVTYVTHSLRVGWRNLPTLRVGWKNPKFFWGFSDPANFLQVHKHLKKKFCRLNRELPRPARPGGRQS
jgi:hypothetical protein